MWDAISEDYVRHTDVVIRPVDVFESSTSLCPESGTSACLVSIFITLKLCLKTSLPSWMTPMDIPGRRVMLRASFISC